MKKTIFFASATIISLICSQSFADTYKYVPYIGVAYTRATARADTAKPEYNIGSLYIGSEYGKYFGTEIFYGQSSYKKNYIADVKTRTSYRAYGLDLAAYLPLGCDNRFDLVAAVGAGEYVFAKKIAGEKHHNDSGWGYRFGGGLKYHLDDNWQIKTLARYVKFNDISDFDRQSEYSIAAEYHF